ncbi:Uncharacterised protein [Vibrio cholerae]|nr:Uncharacterised protein [Vibrio cholerae]
MTVPWQTQTLALLEFGQVQVGIHRAVAPLLLGQRRNAAQIRGSPHAPHHVILGYSTNSFAAAVDLMG